jgi:hypothetical protein
MFIKSAQEAPMPVSIIDHKGKKILYTDFSNIRNNDEMMKVMEESDNMYQQYGNNVRHLINFHNAVTSPEFFERSKQLGKKNVDKCLKDAFTGITSLKGVLLKGYLLFTQANRQAKVFESIEKAKDWLAE